MELDAAAGRPPERRDSGETALVRPSNRSETTSALVVQLVVVAVAGGTCALSLVAQRVLPKRFLLDHSHIVWVMQAPTGSSDASSSFRNIATFYKALGLDHQPELAGLLTLLVFTAAVLVAAPLSSLPAFGPAGLGVLAICFLCGGVYLSQYSKESIPLILTLLFLVLPRGAWAEVVFLVLAGLYALWFRPYWAIIAVFYVGWRILFAKKRGLGTVVLVVAIQYLLLQLAFQAFLGVALTGNRDLVNEGRAGLDVGSLITDPLPDNPVLMVPNALLLLASLVVPIPLVLRATPFHVLSGGMIALLWAHPVLRLLRPGRKVGQAAPRQALAHASGAAALRARRSCALLLSVVTVQAIFEPDFGSYLKHLTPLMPLFLTLVPRRQRPADLAEREAPREVQLV